MRVDYTLLAIGWVPVLVLLTPVSLSLCLWLILASYGLSSLAQFIHCGLCCPASHACGLSSPWLARQRDTGALIGVLLTPVSLSLCLLLVLVSYSLSLFAIEGFYALNDPGR